MASKLSYLAPIAAGFIARGPGAARVLFAILGLGLTLAACSKCDVPNLLPHQAGPQSCHDGPDPQ
jgi:hypothetical protein